MPVPRLLAGRSKFSEQISGASFGRSARGEMQARTTLGRADHPTAKETLRRRSGR
jgi:hypothetical protein